MRWKDNKIKNNIKIHNNIEIQNNIKDIDSQIWKYKNKAYLKELERFFDRVDNIQDEKLQRSVRTQMLLCDKVLTNIAEDMFIKCYKEGYKKAKHE